MLKVLVFDPLRATMPSSVQKLGEHGLIEILGGEADWNARLEAEMEQQIGTLLVTGNGFPRRTPA